MGLLVDQLSILMVLVVTGVGFLIHVYATSYMGHDAGYARFFSYMNLFIVAMLTLVLADNFLMVMIGWGGVGLCSYLLISFWFQRPEAARAGVKAFVVNAVGDVGLLLAAILILLSFGTLDYDGVFTKAVSINQAQPGLITAITLLLLVAAAAKSAQLPLYTWLPDAMAGPTPVSALIHAATMVTAGVYLIARAHPLFLLAPTTMAVVTAIGAVTALFAASAALVKPNIKRVLAYSTVSQLGYMFVAVGVGAFTAGMFHLVNHAFFKALLFLSAGAVIHALDGEEDMSRMGGLKDRLPLVYWTFLVGGLALAGVPLFSGFFSKDEILAAALGEHGSSFAGVLGILAAVFTAAYVGRAIYLTFHGERRSAAARGHLHLPTSAMTVPLVVLAVFSILAGYVQFPAEWFASYLEPVFSRYAVAGAQQPALDSTYWTVAAITFVAVALGIGLAYLVYGHSGPLARRLTYQLVGVWRLLINDYYVEAGYERFGVQPLRDALGGAAAGLEHGLDATVNGIGSLARELGGITASAQGGYVRTYATVFLVGGVAVVAFLLIWGRG
jgi:NADH-quinone oxidoreductase subunit L